MWYFGCEDIQQKCVRSKVEHVDKHGMPRDLSFDGEGRNGRDGRDGNGVAIIVTHYFVALHDVFVRNIISGTVNC